MRRVAYVALAVACATPAAESTPPDVVPGQLVIAVQTDPSVDDVTRATQAVAALLAQTDVEVLAARCAPKNCRLECLPTTCAVTLGRVGAAVDAAWTRENAALLVARAVDDAVLVVSVAVVCRDGERLRADCHVRASSLGFLERSAPTPTMPGVERTPPAAWPFR